MMQWRAGSVCLWDLSWKMDRMRSDSSPSCKEGPLPPGEAPPLPCQHPPAKCPKCHWRWTSKRDERGRWSEEGEGARQKAVAMLEETM